MIIGLTGTMGAGKGEIVKILKQKGFEHYVFSDVLREVAKERNIDPTRENLQKLGAIVKKESGRGILASKLLKKIKTDKAVLDGERNVDEIKELKKNGAHIIGITAPQKVRYQRIKSRKREGDPLTFLQFKRSDNLENRGKTKGQEINNCLNHADFIINNNGTLENLKKQVEDILNKIPFK